MKKHYLLFFLFLLSFETYSQELLMETELVSAPDTNNPKFNGGGMDKFNDFVNKEFDYSKVKKAGKMVASFTIDTEGNLKNIKLVEFIDIESATEMFRVLNKCPKWQPANRAGKIISVEIKYPMVFREKHKELKQSNQVVSETVKTKNDTNEDASLDDGIYTTGMIEKKPDFPGGIQEFYNFIGANYKSPNVKGLSGKVFVSFVIEKDGGVTDIKILRDIGYGTGDEAIRVLKKCPKWIPGEQKGKFVRVQYSLPINIVTK